MQNLSSANNVANSKTPYSFLPAKIYQNSNKNNNLYHNNSNSSIKQINRDQYGGKKTQNSLSNVPLLPIPREIPLEKNNRSNDNKTFINFQS